MRQIVIIGAGGFGREILDVLDDVYCTLERGAPQIVFADDGNPDPELLGAPLIGGLDDLRELEDASYLIGVGNPQTRQRIDDVASLWMEPTSVTHRAATFGRKVEIGPGTVVCSHVSVTTNVRLGRHTHLNLNCTVGHDAVLGDFVTVYPGATISGNVTIGDRVEIGTGANIIQGVTIGSDVVVGAGAVVLDDVPSGVTVVGVPARQR